MCLLSSCTEKIKEAYVSVNLSEKAPKEVIIDDENISIIVYADTYTYSGKKLDLKELEKALITFDKEKTINIKIDKSADHQRLVSLLETMNKHGLSQFNLHTLKTPLNETRTAE